ncbi:MAG: DUF6458 family protein [Mycobacteriales bacterium]
MRIGGSVFLIVLGAILTFAVHVSVSGLDLKVVGWILMIGGGVLLILSLMLLESAPYRRRRMIDEEPTTREYVERRREYPY